MQASEAFVQQYLQKMAGEVGIQTKGKTLGAIIRTRKIVLKKELSLN